MKKALALSMALAMSAAMLAGCGGSASDSTSASGAASSADSAASGTPTVSFMIPDFTGHVLSNEHSDEVIAKYEAYTGTHVEWRTEANDTYSEKFGLTLMEDAGPERQCSRCCQARRLLGSDRVPAGQRGLPQPVPDQPRCSEGPDRGRPDHRHPPLPRHRP